MNVAKTHASLAQRSKQACVFVLEAMQKALDDASEQVEKTPLSGGDATGPNNPKTVKKDGGGRPQVKRKVGPGEKPPAKRKPNKKAAAAAPAGE